MLFSSMPYFKTGLFVFLMLVAVVICIFWILTLCQMDSWWRLFPFCRLPLHLNAGVHCCTEAFQFHEFLFINSFLGGSGDNIFLIPVLLGSCSESFPMPITSSLTPTFSFLDAISFNSMLFSCCFCNFCSFCGCWYSSLLLCSLIECRMLFQFSYIS